MSLTYNGAFEAELCKLIGEHIEALKETMAAGMMDQDGYKRAAGQIQGLKDAIAFCDEANKNLDER